MRQPTYYLVFVFHLCNSLAVLSCGQQPTTHQHAHETADQVIRIYAAAGTRPVTSDICDLFENLVQVNVERNFASSGTLARQISAGAEADLFVSANKQWIDFLSEKHLLKPESIRTVARNTLVIVVPKGKKIPAPRFLSSYDIASSIEHISVGDPAYVPVGKYTEAVFNKLHWSESLREKQILAKDVSSVLNYVAL
ncbi:MAG: molybdate ABC transporter substrate-binding protein, partial [Deltaproteobacteria bacterium]|nr:molybdate ABC transporter substrate-binding protein [Deltaproteobacteria bacterium]MBN2670892.1 molybdate ABC transporter substrate-binding protein [Deltaproteobacteria bacterium]